MTTYMALTKWPKAYTLFCKLSPHRLAPPISLKHSILHIILAYAYLTKYYLLSPPPLTLPYAPLIIQKSLIMLFLASPFERLTLPLSYILHLVHYYTHTRKLKSKLLSFSIYTESFTLHYSPSLASFFITWYYFFYLINQLFLLSFPY